MIHHTMCGGLLCGGDHFSSESSCLRLNPLTGSFSATSVELEHRREQHLCWEQEEGAVLLLGGRISRSSTERVTSDASSSSPSFSLIYDTL